MIRIFGFLIAIFLTQTAVANVTFFNKSSQRNIEVVYKYCYFLKETETETETCLEQQTLVINNNSYSTQQIPTFSEGIHWGAWWGPFIHILSAVGKDAAGNIVARGKFGFDGQSSECSYNISWAMKAPISPNNLNIAIELDDVNLSPMILCRASIY